MLTGQCPRCNHTMDIAPQSGPFNCPHCGAKYLLTIENGRWVIKPNETFDAASPINWFELQIAPSAFRLAIVPGQPVLFGDSEIEKGDSGKGTTTLLDGHQETFLTGLGAIVQTFGAIFSGPQHEPERCFSQDGLSEPSLHLRIAWENGYRWAATYPATDIPLPVYQFFEACRDFGQRTVAQIPTREATGQEALDKLDEARQQRKQQQLMEQYFAAAESAGAVARIKVTQGGDIFLNGTRVTVADVLQEFRRIKPLNGALIYHREQFDQEPTPLAEGAYKAVLEGAMAHELPIMLSETDFDL